MNTGLLWYDDSKQPIEVRALKAAGGYLTKHGRWPDTCYINGEGSQVQAITCRLDDATILRIVPAPYILRNHFWVGESNADGQ